MPAPRVGLRFVSSLEMAGRSHPARVASRLSTAAGGRLAGLSVRSVVATAAALALVVYGVTFPGWARAQSVGALLADPAGYHRREVSVTGRVATPVVDTGDRPSTKFRLRDAGRTLPVYMRGAHQLNPGARYRVDGVFVVKPSADGSTGISGIVGRTVEPAPEPAESAVADRPGFAEPALLDAYSLSVEDLLADPAAFDRVDVGIRGTVARLSVTSGDRPHTKFLLDDGSGALPVYMRGAHRLSEGSAYEVDGVFLVQPAADGAGPHSGIVARTVEPLAVAVAREDAGLPAAAPVPPASAAPASERPAYAAPEYALRELLADQAGFDRRFVSVTGRVTRMTTRYGERVYQKFKLRAQGADVPVFVPYEAGCRLGELCKVTGVFLIKPGTNGAAPVSGIRADTLERLAPAAYRQWTSVVFRGRLGGAGRRLQNPLALMRDE